MRITRRNAILVLGSGLLSAYLPAGRATAREDVRLLDWPHLTFRAPPVAPRERAPVITTVSIHPLEPLLAAAGDDHGVYIWNFEKRELVHTLRGHADWVQAVTFDPSGKWLATAGNDRHVIFWDVATGEAGHVLADPKHVITSLAWSHDGNRIAGTGFESRVRVYESANHHLAWDLDCPCRDMRVVAWSPDDRWLAAAGRNGVTRVWSGRDGQHAWDYRAHRQRVRGIEFSPDGQYLATAGEDRLIHVHFVGKGDEGFDLPPCDTKVLSMTFFGPHHLATGGADNRVRLWDLREQRELGRLTGARGSIAALASRGPWLAAGSFDATARVWTMADHVALEPRTPERARLRTNG